ncbi:serine protease inhibitor A6-like [Hyperolius riggenbachi]|uniref:serine protease inhibitor A6-like n=1 Tax=Hyperolius riggenbachi TaxID=752182 RepID=UPI0035A38254
MKTNLLLWVTICLTLAYHASKANERCVQDDVSIAIVEFAVDLYKNVSSRNAINLVISPISIYTTLAMMAVTARPATRKNILEAMFLNPEKTNEVLHEDISLLINSTIRRKQSVVIRYNNDIFMSGDVHPNFEGNVTKYYRANIHKISFDNPKQAVDDINSYLNKTTRGRIENLMEQLNEKTTMVLLNYFFFNAKFTKKFDLHKTKDGIFQGSDGKNVTVPMMHDSGYFKTYRDSRNSDSKVIQVPYSDNIVLLLILPPMGRLREVETNLTSGTIRKYLHSSRYSLVDLSLPRFNFKNTVELKSALESIGVGNTIYQKTSVNMTETELGLKGGTVVQLSECKPNPEFKVDHPFLMTVYDKDTDTILLIGRFGSPSEI